MGITKITKGLRLTGTVKNDTLMGKTRADTINGLAGDDWLQGNLGNDSLNGGNGNDTLDGGMGSDKLVGGNGDDYYVVDNAKDVVSETNKNSKTGGVDTVDTTLISYTLPKNVENLILSGSKNSKGMGNELDNIFIGNAGNNELDGGKGVDMVVFNHAQSDYELLPDFDNVYKNQITVKYVGTDKVDGTDTLINVEMLSFADTAINVADFIAQKLEEKNNPVISQPQPETITDPIIETPPFFPIDVSKINYEAQAPFVYQSDNLKSLDSITTLLTYNPPVSNGVNYSTFETEQWRTRASASELAIDLTQTTTASSDVVLQGQLEANPNSQIWYKINLTQPSTLQVQDLSVDGNVIDVAIFKDSQQSSLLYSYSLYDSTEQLNSYRNVPAGDYFVRIDKNATNTHDSRLNQALDFNVLINTKTSDDFILPLLNFDAAQSTIYADVSPTKTENFYKFSLSNDAEFSLDATMFASQFQIGIVQPLENGGYDGISYSFFTNKPNKQIYSLSAGTYYLDVKALSALSDAVKIDIPVISTTPIAFNTAFDNSSPNVLKADLTNAKNAISTDTAGNLELTYSFDLSDILGTEDAIPNATPFSEAQKQAARLAFQAYENIAKLTFREIPNGSDENADFTFTNVSSLGSSAGETSTHQSSTNDYTKATVRIDASKEDYAKVDVGNYSYTTLLHEIGHALGLKHPQPYGTGGASSDLPFLLESKDNNQYTVMSYNQHPYQDEKGALLYDYTGAVSVKTPLLYDIAAIQNLYGANSSYNNGDTTYRWDADTDPFMTIWDGSGTDMIDVSNQSQNQVIDLRAGAFSSLGAVKLIYSDNSTKFYPPKDNVSIAYGTLIENAMGSNQDDTLIGNSVANQLTGNSGKDNFVFASQLSNFNVDTITDFNAVDDSLTLDRAIFNALNANHVLSEQELFVSATATSAENTAQRIIFNTSAHSLYYDADGADGGNAILFALLPNLAMLNAGQIFIQG